MPTDLTIRVLKIVSNPVRKAILQSLERTSLRFSDVMRACGLDPNHDTGPFFYHLSLLTDAGLVEKKDSEYRLTDLGGMGTTLINTLQRETKFLLEQEPIPQKGGGRMNNIQAKWLTKTEAQHGEYGILVGGPRRPPTGPEPSAEPEDKPRHRELLAWRDSLPKIEIPAEVLSGHVLGFEKDGVKLGSIHVRFTTGSEVGTTRVISLAQILSINVLGQNCQRIRKTRTSVVRQMMEEFTKLAKEHNVHTIIVQRANAEDRDLVRVLKELSYERYMTTYLMRTTIPV